jgi:transposase
VIIETVVAKYCDHLPLYRQEGMIEREAGAEISRATLDGWVMRVGELLQPAADAMREDLPRTSYLQADETVVPVQMHDGKGSDHPAYLWQYGTPGGETVFDFQLLKRLLIVGRNTVDVINHDHRHRHFAVLHS